MHLPSSSADFLKRAQQLRKGGTAAQLMYAALELRCGIEARLKEFAAYVPGISKAKATEWRIENLGRTLETAFGMGDTMVVLMIRLKTGDAAEFIYAPVTARLQEIGMQCGDYLHAKVVTAEEEPERWQRLASILHEGCGLLELSCVSTIMRPSFEVGIHIVLRPDDPRAAAVEAWQRGEAEVRFAHITPTGRMMFYPAENEQE